MREEIADAISSRLLFISHKVKKMRAAARATLIFFTFYNGEIYSASLITRIPVKLRFFFINSLRGTFVISTLP